MELANQFLHEITEQHAFDMVDTFQQSCQYGLRRGLLAEFNEHVKQIKEYFELKVFIQTQIAKLKSKYSPILQHLEMLFEAKNCIFMTLRDLKSYSSFLTALEINAFRPGRIFNLSHCKTAEIVLWQKRYNDYYISCKINRRIRGRNSVINQYVIPPLQIMCIRSPYFYNEFCHSLYKRKIAIAIKKMHHEEIRYRKTLKKIRLMKLVWQGYFYEHNYTETQEYHDLYHQYLNDLQKLGLTNILDKADNLLLEKICDAVFTVVNNENKFLAQKQLAAYYARNYDIIGQDQNEKNKIFDWLHFLYKHLIRERFFYLSNQKILHFVSFDFVTAATPIINFKYYTKKRQEHFIRYIFKLRPTPHHSLMLNRIENDDLVAFCIGDVEPQIYNKPFTLFT